MAMHHFYRCSPESIGHLMEEFRQALSDPDPGVMEAAVVLLHDVIKVGSELSCIFLIVSFLSLFLSLSLHFPFCLSLSLSLSLSQADPSRHKDLCPAFKSILSQVVARRLPSTFEYHSVPAPWVQIRILRILAMLGADDAK